MVGWVMESNFQWQNYWILFDLSYNHRFKYLQKLIYYKLVTKTLDNFDTLKVKTDLFFGCDEAKNCF